MMHAWPVAVGLAILAGVLPEHATAADPMCAYGPQRFLTAGAPLHGEWRCARVELDADLSLSDRGAETLEKLRLEGGGFEQPGFDDQRWQRVQVPGLVVSPPEPLTGGLLYRTRFAARSPEDGDRALLRFEGAGAIADVWLNGEWVGGHEGEFTPFTLDVTERIREWNTLAVRVHIIPWGTRDDTLPYANCDFWQYGGILRDVCLAWVPAAHVTSLRPLTSAGGFDARVAVRNAAGRQALTAVVVEAFGPFAPRAPEVRGPVPDLSGHRPIARSRAGIRLAAGEWREVAVDVAIPEPRPWSPDSPTLYVLRARIGSDVLAVVTGWRTLRAQGGRLLLNGAPTRVWGVARHEELPETWRACSWADWDRVYEDLARIRGLGCTFLRAGHYPNHPMVAMICDRLGLALWEEIPIYWFGGPQLLTALERGVAQAMWLGMIHRDGASPSLWFLGGANETGWYDERIRFLTELRRLAHEVDGTRLVGQAAVGQGGDDATQEACDFVGMTCYHGVFYSQQEGAYEGTRRALQQAAEAFPDKPIIVAEFGAWAEGEDGEAWQRGILTDTLRAMRENPQVAGATWWTAYDYASPHQQGHPPWHYFGLWNWERDVLRPSGDAYGEALAEE